MNIRKNSLSQAILYILEKTVDGYCKFEDFASNTHIYAFYGGRKVQKSALAKALARLRKSGFIEDRTGTDLEIRLTKLGNQFIKDLNFSEKDWNGYWVGVSFDIPEQKRAVRSLFRRYLKNRGFKLHHKSLWVSKKDIYQELTQTISNLKLHQWVTVFSTNKISFP